MEFNKAALSLGRVASCRAEEAGLEPFVEGERKADPNHLRCILNRRYIFSPPSAVMEVSSQDEVLCRSLHMPLQNAPRSQDMPICLALFDVWQDNVALIAGAGGLWTHPMQMLLPTLGGS